MTLNNGLIFSIMSHRNIFFQQLSKALSVLIFLGVGPINSSLFAQNKIEQNPPDYIQSIQFKKLNSDIQFPILRRGDRMQLEFDDLQAIDADYYYRISYYNHDWSPSNLFQNEYLGGFDNRRIEDFRSSTNTLQRYTHYTLTLPNNDTQFLLSGNYLIEIYDADDRLMFSRRFLMEEAAAQVAVGVFRTRDLETFDSHQTVQFSITPQGSAFRDPDNLVKVVVLQNENWDTAITNLKPQYFDNGTLAYRYDAESRFPAGNEYLFFDTKDLRVSSPSISFIERTDRYDSFLYTDIMRSNLPYTLSPDINGDFEIRTLQGTQEAAIEADYSRVHFSLSALAPLPNADLYVVGKFCNYQLEDRNKMSFNAALGAYEATLLLKQGFYNYCYALKTNQVIDNHLISGNFAQTENRYIVLVYYRNFGDLNDRLVGFGVGSSFQLLN